MAADGSAYPEATIYNQLCDWEWQRPPGRAKSCGGDALMRVAAGPGPWAAIIPACIAARGAGALCPAAREGLADLVPRCRDDATTTLQ